MNEKAPDGLQVLELKTQKDWRDWLNKNHGQTDGVWLKFAKKPLGSQLLTTLRLWKRHFVTVG